MQNNTDPGFKIPGNQADPNAKPPSEPTLSPVPPGAAPAPTAPGAPGASGAPIEVAPVQDQMSEFQQQWDESPALAFITSAHEGWNAGGADWLNDQ
eukprot:gene37226-45932_t